MEFTESSGNVYKDLGFDDADAMLRKARLMARIQEIIENNGWSQREAAKRIGITQPKLCNLLKGRFEGISEMKLLSCLASLGSNIKIVVMEPAELGRQGSIAVEFA